jgi:hypothetical protein
MTSKQVLAVLVLLLLMPLAVVQAQPQTGASEPDASTEPGEQQADDEDNNNEAPDAADASLPDIDSQPIEGSQNQGPGRFIPSEQISQDFGVSFPVDI